MTAADGGLTGRIEVAPADIERELTRIWRDAAKADVRADAGTEHPTRVKAILSNFVVLRAEGDKMGKKDADNLITELCVSNPSRFFIIRYSRQGVAEQQDLKSYVSSRCVLARSGNHVCSEEIYFDLTPAAVQSIPNLLLAHYASDVPVVVLLLGDLFSGAKPGSEELLKLLGAIAEQADLVLYDSLHFPEYQTGVAPFAKLAKQVKVRDLNWYRAERWRVLIAEQFDAQRFLNGVDDISHIKLHCRTNIDNTGRGLVPAKALLVAGWLTAALGWEISKKSAVRGGENLRVLCTAKNGKQPVLEFDSAGVEVGAEEAHLTKVQVVIDQSEGPLALEIVRKVKDQTAEISTEHLGSANKSERFCDFSVIRVPFRTEKMQDIVLQPIQSSGQHDFFAQASSAAAEIASALAGV